MSSIDPSARIFVAGHRGLVGSAILRRLRREGYDNLLTATREQLDLRDQAAVNYWFRANRPEYVFLVAGTVGGILANSTRPAEFLYDNMMIHAHGRSCRASLRRPAAAVSRQLLHLSARMPAADEGGVSAERPAGADQRGVRASPRSPASSCVRPIASSTAATSSPRCRRISTVRTTISI